MKLPHKRGQRTELKNIILITLVGGILMILLVTTILPLFHSTNLKSKCQQSIWLAAFSKKLTGNAVTSPDCEPGEIVLTMDGRYGIVEDGKIDQFKAQKIIADAMAQCWWMVGEGKWDPFTNYNLMDEPICILCDTIKFDEELLSFMAEGLGDDDLSAPERRAGYLVDNPLPFIMNNKIPSAEITYFEYFYKRTPAQLGLDPATRASLIDYPFGPGDTTILVQMIKHDEKGFWDTTGVWIVAGAGVVISVFGFLAAPYTVGASSALIPIGWGLISAVGVLGTTFVLIPQAMTHSFSECKTCNAVGGIALVPDFVQFTDKKEIVFEGKKKEYPLCQIIVN